MPHYKPVDYTQTKLLPINYSEQLIEGTFEHAMNYLVEYELDMSIFDHRYKNEKTGATAYHPRVLLKVILYAYSLGITSSRKIDRLCKQHIVFMALSADSQPHFTTIANFIAKLPKEIEELFLQILLICEEEGLIGREMFATDGCKLPSNASKEWSGTVEELEEKKQKLEQGIKELMLKHRKMDKEESVKGLSERDEKKLETFKGKARKIRNWLKLNKEKLGKSGKAIKSNITDNDSAKMKTSNGVIQGFNGIATVDAKRQVITHANAVGSGGERDQLQPMLEGCRENYKAIEKSEDILKEVSQCADSGFHSTDNVQYLEREKIDGYLPDQNFRRRDSRFDEQGRYKTKEKKTGGRPPHQKKQFSKEDFIVHLEEDLCLCPAGKPMVFQTRTVNNHGFNIVQFRGHEGDCRECPLRQQCLRKPTQKTPRQFTVFQGKAEAKDDAVERMKKKIDSEEGKKQYSKRLGIVEPVFGNITSNIGLKRFSLRGQKKVDAQWKLFSIVHNMGKIQRYAS